MCVPCFPGPERVCSAFALPGGDNYSSAAQNAFRDFSPGYCLLTEIALRAIEGVPDKVGLRPRIRVRTTCNALDRLEYAEIVRTDSLSTPCLMRSHCMERTMANRIRLSAGAPEISRTDLMSFLTSTFHPDQLLAA